MPIVFGEDVSSVEQALSAFGKHGNAVRGTYRARYVWDPSLQNPYAGATIERPIAMRDNSPSAIFPWEQIFIAAANCAGSDYPMLAEHLGVGVERVELIVEGVFDPRGEFDGLGGFQAPPDSRPCYLSLHLRAELVSSAPRESLERIHARVVATNMVLGALRGIPRTSEIVVKPGSGRLPSRTTSSHAEERMITDFDVNKNLVRAFISAWNDRDLSRFDDLMADDAVLHVGGATVPCDPAGTRAIAEQWTTAFPDWRFDLVSLVADDDRVAAHMPYSGTFTNPVLGVAPTGRHVRVDEMVIFRIVGGKIAEAWEVYDESGMWRQLGVPPLPD